MSSRHLRYLRRVYGVAHIVTFPVRHESYERLALAEFFADKFHYIYVAHLVMPADIRIERG